MQTEKARLRRELDKEIKALGKQRDEIFTSRVFGKAIDEEFVRKEGVRIYTEMKRLQTQYDAI